MGTERQIVAANRRRTNRRIPIGAEMRTLAQWSQRSGVPAGTIRQRVEAGWAAERLLAPPTQKAQWWRKERSRE